MQTAAPLAPMTPGAHTAADTITRITLERNCFGCPSGTVLVLQRDGSATLTATGSARRGTQDQVRTGRVRPADFDALARMAVANGFFELQDIYQDPAVQDGAWATISIAQGTQDKRVFRREDAGPAVLRTVEAAIDAVQARIAFSPERR